MILTGIRANNDLTIGNYFGAIMPMIDMATTRSSQYQINLFVPDLHSFTTPIDHSTLQAAIWNNLRIFVAAGLPLDNPDIHIYRQSYIPAHSELTWILDCFTGFGEMSRMTQFKDKSAAYRAKERDFQKFFTDMISQFDSLNVVAEPKSGNQSPDLMVKDASGQTFFVEFKSTKDDGPTVGLFNYPVLMAADILLYNATYVPVGEDQTQHLEFTRDIAERLNSRFSADGEELFTIPKPVKEQHAFFGKDQGLRIKDLQDPTKKMSKSDDTGKGVIFLNDNPETAAKKIMSAATDSVGVIHFDPKNQPGITNLLQILALLTHRDQAEVNQEWEGKSSYGDLKKAVAEAAKEFLGALQAKLTNVTDDTIRAKLETSEAAMRDHANQTLHKVQKAVGLR